MASNDKGADKAASERKAAQDRADQEARALQERNQQEIEQRKQLTGDKGTEGTPQGAGRAYEERPSGTANANGKASATRAGGDPVNSPVIGNPGEQNPIAGNYDYALAATRGNPQALTQPLQSVDVAGGPRRAGARKAEDFKHPVRVRAIRKGEYNGVKEVGEEFDNTRNLAPYPEDDKSWFVPVDQGEYAAAEKRGVERREAEEEQRKQDEDARKALAQFGAGRRG